MSTPMSTHQVDVPVDRPVNELELDGITKGYLGVQALKGVSYPASKDDLIAKAKNNSADDEVMSFLADLPDREFGGPNGVTKEISS